MCAIAIEPQRISQPLSVFFRCGFVVVVHITFVRWLLCACLMVVIAVDSLLSFTCMGVCLCVCVDANVIIKMNTCTGGNI